MEIWRVNRSTRLQNLAARSTVVFNGKPSGNKLGGIHNRMGMKFASKFIGALVVKSQLFKLAKGMLNVAGPTNTQKDGMKSLRFCTNKFAEVCAATYCCPGLMSSQYLNFNQMHMPPVYIQLVGLSHVAGCRDPLRGVASAA
eukprot:1142098-Pelagomonas_calceolata.AAC.6